MAETWRDSFVVQRNPVLNRFLHFLNNLDSEDEVDKDELRKIKLALSSRDKPVFHLILLGCLDNPVLRKAFADEDNEETFSGVLNLIEDQDITISRDMYIDIVLGVGLIEEFLAMILANSQTKDMTDMIEGLVARFIRNEEGFDKAVIETGIVSLVNLVRVSVEHVKPKYFDCFSKLCSFALACSSLKDSDKVILIFRIMAMSILSQEDYENATETAELLQQWKLDETMLYIKSVNVYETFLKCQSEDWKASSFSQEVLLKLEEVVASKSLVNGEKLGVGESSDQIYGNNMTLADYMGGCAYLVNLIFQKHNVEIGGYPSLSSVILAWIEQKPKLKEGDFDVDPENFTYFCELMDKVGDRGMQNYKQDWITKFLTFSASEVVGSKEGSDITEKFIAGASQEIVLEYLGMVSQFEGELSKGQKQTVLNIVTHDLASEKETSDRIKRLFKKVTSSKLRMEDFSVSLNTLCSQLSTIEFEKDSEMLTKHKLEAIRICLQDPLTAVSRLLDQSIRTEHFRVLLEFVEPFFNLSAIQPDEGTEIQLPETLLANSFNKLLKYLPQYPDSLYDLMSSGIGLLISKNALPANHAFIVLKFRLTKYLRGEFIALGLVTGIVILLKNLVKCLASEEGEGDKSRKSLLKEIAEFVMKLYRFLALYTNKSTFSHIMIMRGQIIEILDSLKCSNFKESSFGELKTDLTSDDLLELNVFDIGILYIRCEDAKPLVLESLGKDDLLEELDFKDCLRNTILWISNSCEPEWPTLIQFLFEVVLPSNRAYKKKRFSKVHLLNESVLGVYSLSVEMAIPDAFLHTLKFYDFALKHLKGQGKFRDSERKPILDTLMTVALAMSNIPKHKYKSKNESASSSLYTVLSNVLGKLPESIESGMDGSSRKDLLNKLEGFPELDNKCQTIRLLIGKQLQIEK